MLNNSKTPVVTPPPRSTLASLSVDFKKLDRKYTDVLAKMDELLSLKDECEKLKEKNVELEDKITMLLPLIDKVAELENTCTLLNKEILSIHNTPPTTPSSLCSLHLGMI